MKNNRPSLSPLTSRQRGDFQTPEALAREVWAMCVPATFDTIIEPTCGRGVFLTTIPDELAAKNPSIIGWEILEEHYFSLTNSPILKAQKNVQLICGDIFSISAKDISLAPTDSVLVIGNPPWVTNSEQGVLGGSLRGSNTGQKFNFKALSGLDAMTGKANFDISEAIIMHLVRLLKDRCRRVQFAMLVKFSVMRNILELLASDSRVGDFEFYKIDALRHFGAAVNAGLFKFSIRDRVSSKTSCSLYNQIGGKKTGELAWIKGQMIYDLDAYQENAFVQNEAPNHYVWRQGIKHDASKIMELSLTASGLYNGLGEIVDIETEILYDFYKSSDLYHGRAPRFVIPVYQQDLQDSLSGIEENFPKLYAYLMRHEDVFAGRKSSIYQNKPAFSVFGVGDYTHATYKVAVGGLYPQPVFRFLEPIERPAIVDDTSYLIATENREEAIYLLALLNLDCTKNFLLSISDENGKRRFTKNVLSKVFIPHLNECPLEIRRSLVSAWNNKRTFFATTLEALQDWRRSYQASALQPSLFAS